MTASAASPHTLCRPPDAGSAVLASMLSSTARSASSSERPACSARARKNAPGAVVQQRRVGRAQGRGDEGVGLVAGRADRVVAAAALAHAGGRGCRAAGCRPSRRTASARIGVAGAAVLAPCCRRRLPSARRRAAQRRPDDAGRARRAEARPAPRSCDRRSSCRPVSSRRPGGAESGRPDALASYISQLYSCAMSMRLADVRALADGSSGWPSGCGARLPHAGQQLDRQRARPAATEGPLRVSDLAEREAMTQPGVTMLVNRLADAGLRRARPDPTDRRAALVRITAAGRARAGRAARRARRAAARAPRPSSTTPTATPARARRAARRRAARRRGTRSPSPTIAIRK